MIALITGTDAGTPLKVSPLIRLIQAVIYLWCIGTFCLGNWIALYYVTRTALRWAAPPDFSDALPNL